MALSPWVACQKRGIEIPPIFKSSLFCHLSRFLYGVKSTSSLLPARSNNSKIYIPLKQGQSILQMGGTKSLMIGTIGHVGRSSFTLIDPWGRGEWKRQKTGPSYRDVSTRLAWSYVPSTKQAKPNHIEREERDIGIEDADRNAIFLFVDQLGQLVNKEKEEIKYGMFQSILVWSLCPSNIREIFDCHGRLHSKALFHLSQIALLMKILFFCLSNAPSEKVLPLSTKPTPLHSLSTV